MPTAGQVPVLNFRALRSPSREAVGVRVAPPAVLRSRRDSARDRERLRPCPFGADGDVGIFQSEALKQRWTRPNTRRISVSGLGLMGIGGIADEIATAPFTPLSARSASDRPAG